MVGSELRLEQGEGERRTVVTCYEIGLLGEGGGLSRKFKANAMKGLAGLALGQRERKKKRRTLDVGGCE